MEQAKESRTVHVNADKPTKRIRLSVPEAGDYMFMPDEALSMVKAILYSLNQMGYKPTVITNGQGQFVDIELIGA